HDTAPAGEPQATDTPPAPPETAQGDQPLGEAGLKALQKEREARKALERQLAELAPLKQLADLLGGKSTGDAKTDLERLTERMEDRKSTRLNSSHVKISYAVFGLKKKKTTYERTSRRASRHHW